MGWRAATDRLEVLNGLIEHLGHDLNHGLHQLTNILTAQPVTATDGELCSTPMALTHQPSDDITLIAVSCTDP